MRFFCLILLSYIDYETDYFLIKYFPGIQFNRSYECSILKGYPILFNCKRRRYLADRREKCNIC